MKAKRKIALVKRGNIFEVLAGLKKKKIELPVDIKVEYYSRRESKYLAG